MMLPSAREWLPAQTLREKMLTTSISIVGAHVAETRELLDEIIAVCDHRGLNLARVALPQPLLAGLSETSLGELELTGCYRGVELGAGALVDGSNASILELAFNAGYPDAGNDAPEAPLTKCTLPDPGDWLPSSSLRTSIYQSCMQLGGCDFQGIRAFLDRAVDVCEERGLKLRCIGLPEPALSMLAEEHIVSSDGKFRGIPLYFSACFPFTSTIELEFKGG